MQAFAADEKITLFGFEGADKALRHLNKVFYPRL